MPSGLRSRVLFVAAHRKDRAPNQRFRFEQYLGYLEEHGFDCELSPLLTEADDRLLYEPGRLLGKALLYLRCVRRRAHDARRAGEFDIVFVAREALPTGSTRFERRFKASGAKLVFDFDDAIWRLDVSEGNRALRWLKRPGKTAELIALSDAVIAGNAYLAEYARQFSTRVTIIPTTVDTETYAPQPRTPRKEACIGWSGSPTTLKHFEHAVPALKELKQHYRERLRFAVVGDASYRNDDLGIQGIAWRLEDEVPVLSRFDIGIMPLPDDEWSRGKCGLKGLLYMALGIPAVLSPVGVNREIIRDGENGFLAGHPSQWFAKLSKLVDSAELRQRLGQAGRQTVEARYSVRSQRDRYLDLLRDVAAQPARR